MPNENEKFPQKQNQGNSRDGRQGSSQRDPSQGGRRNDSDNQPNRGKNAGPSSNEPSSPMVDDNDDLDIDNPRR